MELISIRGGAFWIGQNRYTGAIIQREDVKFTDILDVEPELLEQIFNNPEPISRIRRAAFEFNSGWCASIIWGTAAICENQNRGLTNELQFKEEVKNVEVGIYHKNYDIHIDPNTRAAGQGTYIEGYVGAERLRELLIFTIGLTEPDAPAAALVEEYDEDIEDLPDKDF